MARVIAVRRSRPNERQCIFTEQLLQFCLEKRGIAWQPAPRNAQVDNADMLFNETIGNAVMSTFITFKEKVQEHSADIWNRISHLPDPVAFDVLDRNIYEVAREIYRSGDAMENTYIFLAVMVDVAMQCTSSGRQYMIQRFVTILPPILDMKMPNGFLLDYGTFLLYAIQHPLPADEYGAFLLLAIRQPEPSES